MTTQDSQTILIVDDDKMYANILQSILEDEGYKVSKAENGIQGLSTIVSVRPDLVLMDFEMPGMDGLEVIKWVKEQQSLTNIPFIMLTGHSDSETVKGAIASGAVDFIVKPVERESLIKKLSSHLN